MVSKGHEYLPGPRQQRAGDVLEEHLDGREVLESIDRAICVEESAHEAPLILHVIENPIRNADLIPDLIRRVEASPAQFPHQMGRGDIDIHRGTTTPHRGDAWAELEQTLHQILQIGNVESIGVDINRDADLSGSDVAIAEHDSTELGQVGAMGRHIDDSSVMADLSVLLRFRGYPQADEPIVYRVWGTSRARVARSSAPACVDRIVEGKFPSINSAGASPLLDGRASHPYNNRCPWAGC